MDVCVLLEVHENNSHDPQEMGLFPHTATGQTEKYMRQQTRLSIKEGHNYQVASQVTTLFTVCIPS